jgi:hypothetical protein
MINFDIPMADYRALERLGGSTAHKALTQSPQHALHWMVTEKQSKVADKGTAAHMLILEGREDDIVLIKADDWRTNAAKAARDEAYAAGQTPLLEKEMAGISAMANAVKAYVDQTELAGMWTAGKPEATVTWDDNGVQCKARPDYLTDKFHVSLKTTEASADPATWARRQLSPMGYDFSLRFYHRGLLANDLDVEGRILVIEQKPPFGCSLFALSPGKVAIADAMVEHAIKLWGECIKTGMYPSYTTETAWVEVMPWELADAEAKGYADLV